MKPIFWVTLASLFTTAAAEGLSMGDFQEAVSYPIPPRGPMGPPGPPGPDGNEGPKGHPGPDGYPGSKGPIGEQGEKGVQGPQGERGPRGEIGPQGEEGDQGPAGLRGAVGPSGVRGAPGCEGAIGVQGPRGVQGDKGSIGAPRDMDHIFCLSSEYQSLKTADFVEFPHTTVLSGKAIQQITPHTFQLTDPGFYFIVVTLPTGTRLPHELAVRIDGIDAILKEGGSAYDNDQAILQGIVQVTAASALLNVVNTAAPISYHAPVAISIIKIAN